MLKILLIIETWKIILLNYKYLIKLSVKGTKKYKTT